MLRIVRLVLVLMVVAAGAGMPLGMALGSFATGETLYARMPGSVLPDQGTQLRSAANADAFQPAAVAYTQRDRYAASAAYWVE
jgi:hypothetical protein